MNRQIKSIRIYADPAALALSAAEEFFARALRAHGENKTFSCVLSGGTTPLHLFARMSDPDVLAKLPGGFWRFVHFFWGDERSVPPDHPDSNYRQARDALFCRIGIPEENVHRIRPELGAPADAAASYENDIRRFFILSPEEVPRFDLVFLGMGEDGHIASLFPYSHILNEKTRLAAASLVARLNAYRITLTLPVFNNAACIIFLVQGSGKAQTLARVMAGAWCPDQLPAQAVQPGAGELIWLLDQAAAAEL
jgi:6-phosphogluconolactonase